MFIVIFLQLFCRLDMFSKSNLKGHCRSCMREELREREESGRPGRCWDDGGMEWA